VYRLDIQRCAALNLISPHRFWTHLGNTREFSPSAATLTRRAYFGKKKKITQIKQQPNHTVRKINEKHSSSSPRLTRFHHREGTGCQKIYVSRRWFFFRTKGFYTHSSLAGGWGKRLEKSYVCSDVCVCARAGAAGSNRLYIARVVTCWAAGS